MASGFERFVAKRYLVTRKKTGFISLISLISIAGIAVGVAALIIVLSLMNGFSKELRTRLMAMDGHIWIRSAISTGIISYEPLVESLAGMPGTVGASPFCSFQTAARDQRSGLITSVEVRGVDINTVDSVSDIRKYITSTGTFDLSRDQNDVPGVVLGSYLAYNLGYTDVGDTVFIYGYTDLEELMMTVPPVYKFRVTGIFQSGFYDYDNMVMVIDIAEAQEMLEFEGMASGISVKLENMFDTPRYIAPGGLIDQASGGRALSAEDWIQKNRTLFKWMQLEKWAAFIVLSLIVLVAAFNIVSSLIMLVMDKTREIGILKSMGATRKNIERIFVYQGAFIGICGTILGGVIGVGLTWLQDRYQIISLPPDIYFISALPMELMPRDVAAIIVVTMLLCFMSSFYPAKKAAALDPVEAIRSE